MPKKRVESVEELKNIYFLYGDEELLVENALKRLQDLLASQVDADFNMEVLNAPEVGAERKVDSAETIPLMSSRRLVIARDIDKLPRKGQELISEYLDRPNPATTLVMVAHVSGPGESRDVGTLKRMESGALFKKAKASGEVLKFSLSGRGKQQKLEEWITEQFRKRGKRVETPARDLLLENVGRELRDLQDATERVSLFVADREIVRVADVAQVVAPAAEQGVFELVDAVADRRRDLSIFLLNRLIRQGESPQRIFNLLLRQFRLIARCRSLAAGHEYPAIATELSIPPFLVGKCVQQSKRFSAERLRSAFGEFKRAQVEMHSTKYLPDADYQAHVLEMLIVNIIG